MERGAEQLREGALATLRITKTAKESAAYIGMSYWKFLEEIKAGRIPHLKAGNRILCRQSSLDHWMDQQEAASIRQEETEPAGKIRRLK